MRSEKEIRSMLKRIKKDIELYAKNKYWVNGLISESWMNALEWVLEEEDSKRLRRAAEPLPGI